jgi:hypothetical protein
MESKLGPLGTSATNWSIVPVPGDCEDGEFSGMKIGRGNRSTRRKPVPAPHCPPQIPLDQTRARTRAAAAGSQRLTDWTTNITIRTKPEMALHVLLASSSFLCLSSWWFFFLLYHRNNIKQTPRLMKSNSLYFRSWCEDDTGERGIHLHPDSGLTRDEPSKPLWMTRRRFVRNKFETCQFW